MKDVQGLINLMPFESYDQLQERISKEVLSDNRRSLYDLLKKNEYKNVDELMMDLNGKASRKAVLKTVQRLKNQLLNKLFFIDIVKTNTTSLHKKVLEIYKRYAALKILEQSQDRGAFSELAKELIISAQKYNLDDVVMLLAERLEFHFSVIQLNEKQAVKYAEMYQDALNRLNMKREVSKYYHLFIQMIIGKKQLYTLEYLNEFEPKMERLKEISQQLPSHHIVQRVNTTLYFYGLLRRDYRRMVEICDESLIYFTSKENYSVLQIYMFELRKGVAFIHLQDYKSARPLLQGLNRFNATPGTLHWNSGRSYQFILEMITGHYQEAADILVETVTEKSNKNISDLWIQQWNIRSAYIHFLAKIGRVDLETFGKKRVPNFRLGKFLNNVPLYSKDKRGLNIAVIIAQFLILLSEKKYDDIADRMEALNKYSYRHLKNDNSLRSNCFIRMLLQLPRANYHPIRARRYAKKFIETLHTTDINLSEYSTEIEIIPFEDLWQIILELMAKRLKVEL